MSKAKSGEVVSLKTVSEKRHFTKRSRRRPSRSPGTGLHVDNVLALIDEHTLSHDGRDELGETVDLLMDEVDWALVDPSAIKAVLRLVLNSVPSEGVTALSKRADYEREILRAVATGRDSDVEPTERDGLRGFDLELISWVANACEEHNCRDFIAEVFAMPAGARRKIADIIGKVQGCHIAGGLDVMDPAERHRLIARLHDEVRRHGGPQSLADAFVLSPTEWDAKYVQPLQASKSAARVP